MAAQLLRPTHPWRTFDRAKARLFYVPALLGVSMWKTPWAHKFTGSDGNRCVDPRARNEEVP